MKSVKLLELFILAFIASIVMMLTGAANAEALDDYSMKPLKVSYADVPPTVDRPASASLTLNVEYPNGCYQIFQSRVMRSGSNVIDVVPYATVSHGRCIDVIRQLQKSVDLGMLQQGEYLVRVHSADGNIIDKKMTIR